MPQSALCQMIAARKEAGISQVQLGPMIYSTESAIKKLECGETKNPHPDFIDAYCKAVGRPELWHTWMCEQYDSFRGYYPIFVPVNGEGMALLQAKKEAQDFIDLWPKLENALFTGEIGRVDCNELRGQAIKEAKEVLASFANAIAQLDKT